jgi:hypothetical protein
MEGHGLEMTQEFVSGNLEQRRDWLPQRAAILTYETLLDYDKLVRKIVFITRLQLQQ